LEFCAQRGYDGDCDEDDDDYVNDDVGDFCNASCVGVCDGSSDVCVFSFGDVFYVSKGDDVFDCVSFSILDGIAGFVF